MLYYKTAIEEINVPLHSFHDVPEPGRAHWDGQVLEVSLPGVDPESVTAEFGPDRIYLTWTDRTGGKQKRQWQIGEGYADVEGQLKDGLLRLTPVPAQRKPIRLK